MKGWGTIHFLQWSSFIKMLRVPWVLCLRRSLLYPSIILALPGNPSCFLFYLVRRSYGEKPSWYLSKVPSGLLPAISLDGQVLCTSSTCDCVGCAIYSWSAAGSDVASTGGGFTVVYIINSCNSAFNTYSSRCSNVKSLFSFWNAADKWSFSPSLISVSGTADHRVSRHYANAGSRISQTSAYAPRPWHARVPRGCQVIFVARWCYYVISWWWLRVHCSCDRAARELSFPGILQMISLVAGRVYHNPCGNTLYFHHNYLPHYSFSNKTVALSLLSSKLVTYHRQCPGWWWLLCYWRLLNLERELFRWWCQLVFRSGDSSRGAFEKTLDKV